MLALQISNQLRNFDLGYLFNIYLLGTSVFIVFIYLISLLFIFLNQLGNEPYVAGTLFMSVFIRAEYLNVSFSRDKEIGNFNFSLTYQMSCDLALPFNIILTSNGHYQTSF